MNRHSSAGSPLSSRAVPSRSARPRRRHLEWLQTTHGLLVWLGLSASLALLMWWLPTLATLHGGLVAVGVIVVGLSGVPALVMIMAAYVAGSEILWRMSGASTPWLLGEYSIILLFGLALLRSRRRPPALGLLYLLPLFISLPLTFRAIPSLEEARQAIAFNLAGPIALFVTYWYTKVMSQRASEPRVAVSVFLGPAFGVAVLAIGSLVSAESVEFTDASNFVASAGYGPNQVASVLSLGLLLVVQQRFMVKWRGFRGLVLSVIAVLFAFQTALTFSRSGLAMAAGAFAVTLGFALKRPRQRITALTSGFAIAFLFAFVLVPSLETVTHGGFSQRYTNPNLTGREAIAKTDLQIWWQNPVLGVGPGIATEMRAQYMGLKLAGHTEFTRMLAEHGVFGLVSVCALVAILIQLVRQRRGSEFGPISAGLATWVALYFAVNAFRLVLPAFAIGLAAVMRATVVRQGVPEVRRRPNRATR